MHTALLIGKPGGHLELPRYTARSLVANDKQENVAGDCDYCLVLQVLDEL